MEKGTVKKVFSDRGFGFIKPADGHGVDIFFHCKALNGLVFDEALLGQEVEFVVGTSHRTGKPEAQVVQPVDYVGDVQPQARRRA